MNATTTTTTAAAAAVVRLPAKQHKAIKSSSIDALISAVLPAVSFNDDDIVKASSIHCTSDLANAGMGASATPTSFINGLIWHLAKAGHSKLVIPVGMPASSAYVLMHAFNACGKAGNGFTAGVIRRAVQGAITSALEAGPYKKGAATVAAPVAAPVAPVATVAPVAAPVAALTAEQAVSAVMLCNPSLDNRADEAIAAYVTTYGQAMQQAHQKAEVEQQKRDSLAHSIRQYDVRIAAYEELLHNIAAASTIREVRTLLKAQGF